MIDSRIFINYRRGDSQGSAGRLFDRLLHHFKREQIFIDVDAIEPGVDFIASLDKQVSNCSAFVAVIGPGWLNATNADGRRRLDDPCDNVRVEIESALKRDIRVIPVLVDGASMPRPSDLPSSLQPLSRRNAVEIAHHRFAADCDHLAVAIKRALGMAASPATALQAAVQPLPELAAQSFFDSTTAQPSINQTSLKRLVANKRSWPEILFSFRGRISRRPFVLGILILVASAFVLGVPMLMITDQDLGAIDDPATRSLRHLIENRFLTVMSACLAWPSWALVLKRLHDIGHGWMLFLIMVALDISVTVADALDMDDLSSRLTLVYLGFIVMLAAIKGVPGGNKYGPDPLAPAETSSERAPA
jgi:uncharacterized membrane protein YhaH (DUF805 family)